MCWAGAGLGQYWQQQVNYKIEVTLNDSEKTLDAFEQVTYYNKSPDTLRFIWFHLWPNAYRNDRTSFSEQMLLNGNTRFYFSDNSQKGYINRLLFKANGVIAKTEEHPLYIDVTKVLLPNPLAPGDSVQITTPFHEKLPFNFSRGGYDGNSFEITQWYPKPAVYDRSGWHPMPYLDQGEYYSEFGNYDVRITLPASYKVAATGNLLSGHEAENSMAVARSDKATASSSRHVKRPGNKRAAVALKFPAPDSMKTLYYRQEQVHDFAWFANKRFIIERDSCKLSSGKVVEVCSYYTPEQSRIWKSNSVSYAKEALRFYSLQVQEYPYRTLKVVQGPQSFGGGMEYPTITVISPTNSLQSLNETIVHEIGHNWFYGVIASNERDHPWMDEGINTFYDEKYVEEKYGHQPELLNILLQTKAIHLTDQPIETTSEAFSQLNYELIAYYKTARFLRGLENRIGVDSFRNSMRRYYETWQFRHPYPEDFSGAFLQNAGTDSSLAQYFGELNRTGILPGDSLRGTSFVCPFVIRSIAKYLTYPTKHAYIATPAVGFNLYDKLMLGGLITNYKLPPEPLQFFIVPLYATGSHLLTGIAKLNLTLHSNGVFRKTDFFVNASRFSINQIEDPAGRTITMQFSKAAPGIRLTLREPDPRSTTTRFVQWKTYLVNEPGPSLLSDTAITNGDSVIHYRVPNQTRYLNELRFFYGNFRALYPYDMNLQFEQAKDFLRPAVTLNYFFNYAKEGGIQLRFFAGKFIYIGGKTGDKAFQNDRYFLNLSGPNGAEDYNYHDYFVGRNAFDGLPSQQMMIRDGAFKIRTDLLIDKVGKTDDWLTAVNLTSSIPAAVNPLSVLPLKIPLQIFCDVGTYAERWLPNAGGERFLFDAGFQLSLLKGVVNIYAPLLYSRVFRDYVKSYLPSGRFPRTISFSIDLNSKQLKKINPEIEL